MRKLTILAVLALLAGCGGKDGGGGPPVPDGATQMQTFVRDGVATITPGLGRFDALLPFLSNPGSPGATGITFGLDLSPGAPPNRYVFHLPLDADGDGTFETTIEGTALIDGDPAHPAVGFAGTATLTIQTVGGLGDFAGTINFELTADGTRLSGSGTCSEPVSGNTTTMTVDPSAPLLVKMATGGAGAVANACAYSVGGNLGVSVEGPQGFLGMVWEFVLSQENVRVTHATFHAPGGDEVTLGNAEVAIPCNGGSLQDWVGSYVQDYSCLSPEYGQARLTITRTSATTLHIVDEDPPGSGDTNAYNAAMVSGNPHVVRGYFIAGPVGSTYREDFSWTLSANGQSFSQVSVYQFQEGMNAGSGGLCSGQATRETAR